MSLVASKLLESVVSASDPRIVVLLKCIGVDVDIECHTTVKSAFQELALRSLFSCFRLTSCAFAFPNTVATVGNIDVVVGASTPSPSVVRVVGTSAGDLIAPPGIDNVDRFPGSIDGGDASKSSGEGSELHDD